MYEILIKLENDLQEQKYTLENLKELKELLNDLKTKEVKIRRIKKRCVIKNETIKYNNKKRIARRRKHLDQ